MFMTENHMFLTLMVQKDIYILMQCLLMLITKRKVFIDVNVTGRSVY